MKSLLSKLKDRFLPNEPAPPAPAASVQETRLPAEEWKQKGNDALAAGDLRRAEECYRQALRERPGYAEAMVNLGVVLSAQGRMLDAESAFRDAVDANAGLWQAAYHLALMLQEQGKKEESKRLMRQACGLNPSLHELRWRLGTMEMLDQRWLEAIQALEHARTLEPDHAEVLSNLGGCLMKLGRHEEAYAVIRQALAQREIAESHLLAGVISEELRREEQAMQHYQDAVRLDPQSHTAHYQLSYLALARGDYRNGFAHFEHRFQAATNMPGLAKGQALIAQLGAARHWTGQDLRGKTLLVVTEQGLGDSIMMMRYLPLLKERFGTKAVLVRCEAPLLSMFRALPGVDAAHAEAEPLPPAAFDLFCMTMSLPQRFGSVAGTIPEAPYLRIPEALRARWNDRMAGVSGLKVGLAWAGNKLLEKDAIRSMSLDMLAPLFALDGVSWFSLQKGEPAAQLQGSVHPVIDWMDDCNDLLDTASLISHLDLVLSVDTAVAHLAGATGCRTWLMNRYDTEWRWLLSGDTSPWYGGMTIIRQPARGDWQGVVERIGDALPSLIEKAEA
ncbi:tetratricopeptide repeat protein [Noviherbaspirillum galbum]|uniref:Tetratricopeptide repeat protein n=1 Tax=Noviherbaspirillum galbum TaxID=2709383 RepID=A0A6B3SFL3_9BURK|nr:tetratricopeptide repeat protein [Noviherbaspirillum galbum]NEX59611.1 tetratricopeptide repeat protein [Noviherbaspirillum galbum]